MAEQTNIRFKIYSRVLIFFAVYCAIVFTGLYEAHAGFVSDITSNGYGTPSNPLIAAIAFLLMSIPWLLGLGAWVVICSMIDSFSNRNQNEESVPAKVGDTNDSRRRF